MQKPQLKRTLTNLGLELVGYQNGSGNAINIQLQAPDGTVGKFQISRLDDPNSDKININQMKHFARDHSGMRVEVLDLTPTPVSDMEAAIHATVLEHDPDTIKFAKKAYRKQPLMNPVGMLLSGASEPIPQPPAPMIQQEIEMPVSLTKPSLVKANKPKTDRKQVRMGQVEFFKLCNVLNEMDMIGIDSLGKLAAKLSKAAGRDVAVGTAKDAMEATGKKLDKMVIVATDAQMVIARTLTALLIKLSEEVPPELRKLCGEIE